MKRSMTRFSTRFLAALGMTIILIVTGCNDAKEPPSTIKPAVISDQNLVGIITDTSGTRYLGVAKRRIVGYSINGKLTMGSDTLVGVFRTMPFLDALKQPLKTKDGRDSVWNAWFVIGKDSVNFHVENISIDSLLKK